MLIGGQLLHLASLYSYYMSHCFPELTMEGRSRLIKNLLYCSTLHVSVIEGADYPLNDELIPICHLQALLGAHHILHFFRIMVKFRLFRKSQKNIMQYK